MAKDTSLTVSLFGRDVSFGKTLGAAGKNAKTTTQSIEAMGRKAGLVFGAIAAAGVLAAKNAAQDAASQRVLALTLENTSKATKKQVAAVEAYISKTSLAVGIVDDELRPAFARLSLSTNNTKKSQELLNLALDIKAAKPAKSLESIVNALGKAYDGNGTSLGRLGLGLDSSLLKSKNFDKIFTALTKTFKGFAKQEANTTEAKMRRLKIATDELKESMGYMLLPYLEKLTDVFAKMIPFLERNKSLIGKVAVTIAALAGFVLAVNAALKVFYALQSAKAFAAIIARWAGFTVAVESSGAGIAAAGAAAEIAWAPFLLSITAIAAAFVGINLVLNKMKKNREALLNDPKKIPSWSTESNKFFPNTSISAVPRHAKGGIVTKAHIGMVGEAGPEAIIPLNKASGLGGITIVNNIRGAVTTEKELALVLRNEIAQLMRRKGLNPAILGV